MLDLGLCGSGLRGGERVLLALLPVAGGHGRAAALADEPAGPELAQPEGADGRGLAGNLWEAQRLCAQNNIAGFFQRSSIEVC